MIKQNKTLKINLVYIFKTLIKLIYYSKYYILSSTDSFYN